MAIRCYAISLLFIISPCARGSQRRAAPRHAPGPSGYVGSKACAQCHLAEAAAQTATGMAHALARPAESVILRDHPVLTFKNGPYLYKIVRQGNGSLYSVTDGRRIITVPILWAFGYGTEGVGQTYVFRYGGYFFESQVSYYTAIHGLDITIGHISYPPSSLGAALGYPLSPDSVRKCFACHATGAVSGSHLRLDNMIPGVSCEACHGPGARHIAAVKAGDAASLQIFNPGRLSTDGLTAFCGACHRAAAQEKVLKIRGVENVRFQAYRLQRSRCYNPEDSRISCITCHDPHRPAAREARYYDAKCLACHGRSAPSRAALARPCPVAAHDCVTCHMPKIEIPGTHHKFTDHFIRVVKPNQPYPS
ncbi:MAG: multiheme c-type cytochrome [Candidatus Acidiferrales bacterium]